MIEIVVAAPVDDDRIVGTNTSFLVIITYKICSRCPRWQLQRHQPTPLNLMVQKGIKQTRFEGANSAPMCRPSHQPVLAGQAYCIFFLRDDHGLFECAQIWPYISFWGAQRAGRLQAHPTYGRCGVGGTPAETRPTHHHPIRRADLWAPVAATRLPPYYVTELGHLYRVAMWGRP
jgi:hypothetical protein